MGGGTKQSRNSTLLGKTTPDASTPPVAASRRAGSESSEVIFLGKRSRRTVLCSGKLDPSWVSDRPEPLLLPVAASTASTSCVDAPPPRHRANSGASRRRVTGSTGPALRQRPRLLSHGWLACGRRNVNTGDVVTSLRDRCYPLQLVCRWGGGGHRECCLCSPPTQPEGCVVTVAARVKRLASFHTAATGLDASALM